MDGIQQDRLESDDQQDERPPASQRIQRHLLRRMGRGFLVLIPLLITLLIVRYLVAVVEALFSPFVASPHRPNLHSEHPRSRFDHMGRCTGPDTRLLLSAWHPGNRPALAEQGVRRAKRDLEPDTGSQDHLQRCASGDRDTIRPHAAKIQPRGVLGVAEAGYSSNGSRYRTVPSARRPPEDAGGLYRDCPKPDLRYAGSLTRG